MMTLAIIAMLIGAVLVGKYFYDKNKKEDEKGIVVVGTTLLLMFLFPGAALFILGFVILAILLL